MIASRPLAALAVLLAAAALGTACGADDNGGAVGAGPTTTGLPVDVALVVDVRGASGGDRSGSVTCQGQTSSGTGSLLDATASRAACAVLLHDAALSRRLTQGPATGQACTEQDGGSATAHVTGTFRGAPVDAAFSRHGGCEIGDWQALTALLGPP